MIHHDAAVCFTPTNMVALLLSIPRICCTLLHTGSTLMIVAVRDDRMPGGRNSGAVYNLYKVSVSLLSGRWNVRFVLRSSRHLGSVQ